MAGVKMCKTREMKTASTATMAHKKALANTRVAIPSLKVMHTKVVKEKPATTTTKVEIPMEVATIKARTTDNKKQIPHNQVETEP
jgi:hypothetical protein